MSVNSVCISGGLTRNPELRSTQGGTQILSFSMAVNDRRRNPQNDGWEDFPNYVDCVVFGARAEPLSRLLKKGSRVFVSGKLRWSQWERDGQKRSKLEVVVSEIDFIGPRKGSEGDSGASDDSVGDYGSQGYGTSGNGRTNASAGQDLYDDEIPF